MNLRSLTFFLPLWERKGKALVPGEMGRQKRGRKQKKQFSDTHDNPLIFVSLGT